MEMFISCDWGTSSFRLRLVDVTNLNVLAEVKSNQGIADVFSLWKKREGNEAERLSFYQSILHEQLAELQKQVTNSLHDRPIIVSGMASANIGMVELPYKELPFAVDGSDLIFRKIHATDFFPHEIVVISGARSNHDVMRGEETQLIGCDFHTDQERIYILPGTHSKHVTVIEKRVTDFKTYMTGEFFRLLSHHSILAKSVEENSQSLAGESLKKFEEGVTQSIQENILHNAFLVRTNHLLNNVSKEQNYFYLSGLLIGTELNEMARSKVPLTLVANESMRTYYTTALQKFGNNNFETVDVDVALVKGHCKVHQFIKGSQTSRT